MRFNHLALVFVAGCLALPLTAQADTCSELYTKSEDIAKCRRADEARGRERAKDDAKNRADYLEANGKWKKYDEDRKAGKITEKDSKSSGPSKVTPK